MRIVILASGSGSLSQALFHAFAHPESPLTFAGVVSDKPQAGVLEKARAHTLPTFCVPPADYSDRAAWTHALTEQVLALAPDWIISAGFMRILGPEFVHRFASRIINTHPALLPAFPGAHAVRDTMAGGARVAGTTFHLIDEGIDTGPIIAQFPVAVLPTDSEASLHERIRAIERVRLVELVGWLANNELTVRGHAASGWNPDWTASTAGVSTH